MAAPLGPHPVRRGLSSQPEQPGRDARGNLGRPPKAPRLRSRFGQDLTAAPDLESSHMAASRPRQVSVAAGPLDVDGSVSPQPRCDAIALIRASGTYVAAPMAPRLDKQRQNTPFDLVPGSAHRPASRAVHGRARSPAPRTDPDALHR